MAITIQRKRRMKKPKPKPITKSELSKMSELNAQALTLRYGLDGGNCRTIQQVADAMNLGTPAVQYHLKRAMDALTPDRRKELRESITIRRGNFAQPLEGNTPSVRFANRLMAIRKSRGLNQEQMAALLGLELTTYNAYESGRNRPQMERFFDMCKALGMTPSEVLKGV